MYVELYTGLYLNCCDFFYLLEYFISGIGMLLEFRLLFSPDIFLKAKKRKSRGLYRLHHSTLALDSLVMEVSESRPFSNYFMRLANVVFSPSASLAGLVSSSSCNHSFWLQCDLVPTVAQSQISCWTLNLSVPPDVRLFGFFKD